MIAVVGCGRWGRNWVRVLSGIGGLCMVCDSDPARLAGCWPAPVGTTVDVADVAASLDVRAVVVATPAATHYQISKQLLLAGKDVLVEKPMALSVEQGSELVELAERESCILMVGHVLEYHPAVSSLKRLVGEGVLGPIRYLYSNRLNTGVVRTEENVLWSFAPHDVSVMLTLVGHMPERVFAHDLCRSGKGVSDATVTVLEFPGYVKAHIFVSWLHPFKRQELVVIGDKGMAVFDDTKEDGKLVLYEHHLVNRQPSIYRTTRVQYARAEPLAVEAQDFVECVKSRAKPQVDGEKGVQVLEVLEMCRRAL